MPTPSNYGLKSPLFLVPRPRRLKEEKRVGAWGGETKVVCLDTVSMKPFTIGGVVPKSVDIWVKQEGYFRRVLVQALNSRSASLHLAV